MPPAKVSEEQVRDAARLLERAQRAHDKAKNDTTRERCRKRVITVKAYVEALKRRLGVRF